MSINAVLVSQKLQFDLPLGKDMVKLEKFLKEKGFRFNKRSGKFEFTEAKEGKEPEVTAYWNMRNGYNNVVSTLEGVPFPFAGEIEDIIYPVKPKSFYILEGDGKDLDKIIKTLFMNRFEIVSLSINGIYQMFVLKDNFVTIYQNFNGKYKLEFKGSDKIFNEVFKSININ
jgi:hypothetical protein